MSFPGDTQVRSTGGVLYLNVSITNQIKVNCKGMETPEETDELFYREMATI